MRVTLTSDGKAFELALGESPAKGAVVHLFETDEELASFLRPLFADPGNNSAVSTLRRALFSDSAASAGRSADPAALAGRYASIFRRMKGIVQSASTAPLGGVAPMALPAQAPASLTRATQTKVRDVPPAQLSEFRILEVEFLSDHGKLKNHRADWRNEGQLYRPPDWRRNRSDDLQSPISHSMTFQRHKDAPPEKERFTLRATIEVGPPEGLPQYGELVCRADSIFSHTTHRRSFEAGRATLEFELAGQIPSEVGKTTLKLGWWLKLEKSGNLYGGATEHPVYCIHGTPFDANSKEWPEDGVTLKRLEAAIEHASFFQTPVTHKLVEALMSRFGPYTLIPNPKVPEIYRHPSYINAAGGAWAMDEYPNESGECQAIVRYVRGVIRQLGLPGKVEGFQIYADPLNPSKELAQKLRVGDGLRSVDVEHVVEGKKDQNGEPLTETWEAALTDQTVSEGEFYPEELPPGSKQKPVGFNSYEAVLKFTEVNEKGEDGTTVLYAGGAGKKTSEHHVLSCFKQLVWRVEGINARGQQGSFIRKVVATYDENGDVVS